MLRNLCVKSLFSGCAAVKASSSSTIATAAIPIQCLRSSSSSSSAVRSFSFVPKSYYVNRGAGHKVVNINNNASSSYTSEFISEEKQVAYAKEVLKETGIGIGGALGVGCTLGLFPTAAMVCVIPGIIGGFYATYKFVRSEPNTSEQSKYFHLGVASMGMLISPGIALAYATDPVTVPLAICSSIVPMGIAVKVASQYKPGHFASFGPLIGYGLLGVCVVDLSVLVASLAMGMEFRSYWLMEAGLVSTMFLGITVYDVNQAMKNAADGIFNAKGAAYDLVLNFVNIFIRVLELIRAMRQ